MKPENLGFGNFSSGFEEKIFISALEKEGKNWNIGKECWGKHWAEWKQWQVSFLVLWEGSRMLGGLFCPFLDCEEIYMTKPKINALNVKLCKVCRVRCQHEMMYSFHPHPYHHGTAWRMNTPVYCSSQSCLSGTDSADITDMWVFKRCVWRCWSCHTTFARLQRTQNHTGWFRDGPLIIPAWNKLQILRFIREFSQEMKLVECFS